MYTLLRETPLLVVSTRVNGWKLLLLWCVCFRPDWGAVLLASVGFCDLTLLPSTPARTFVAQHIFHVRDVSRKLYHLKLWDDYLYHFAFACNGAYRMA
ncbi:hypothetical protein BDB00DRAFT_469958 [Zychaea mexicana]|uniref:uncharacterized protein n=1 Tax=Zychaea mexicana TaxID=64656 RepID=UPI0022FE4076|nr:uncharacterized protein BDB00DRAFT_469958 [Zychaea mexicana]KAI9491911.1 hypothetical protein BDB00DRAFT_469958 [Zychaea mexicana]